MLSQRVMASPPPWTTTTRAPAPCKAARSARVVSPCPRVLPPIFTTSKPYPTRPRVMALGGVLAVEANILLADVAAPGRCDAVPQAQVDDQEGAGHEAGGAARLHRREGPADLHLDALGRPLPVAGDGPGEIYAQGLQ